MAKKVVDVRDLEASIRSAMESSEANLTTHSRKMAYLKALRQAALNVAIQEVETSMRESASR